MIARTTSLLYLTLVHSLEQHTTVYLEATWGAFVHGAQAWRQRRPIPASLARRLRIPLHMAFILFR